MVEFCFVIEILKYNDLKFGRIFFLNGEVYLKYFFIYLFIKSLEINGRMKMI